MMRIGNKCAPALLAAAVLLAAGPAGAQERKYAPWSNQGFQAPGAERAENLLRDLRTLIDEAAQDRAADPRFLRDLNDLVRRYDTPWRVEILRDDFSDGDFTKNPAWTVAAGRFWVEGGYGLRSAPDLAQRSQKKMSREELAATILGTFLNKNQRQQQQPSPEPRGHAAINVARPIPNAFAIGVALTSWERKGQFEIGPYYSGAGSTGYRLIYAPGATPALKLMRVAPWGSGVAGIYNKALALEDRRVHKIEWTRDRGGEMVVRVDGTEMIRAVDRGFTGAFDGLVMVNQGGDYVVKSITVHGTNAPIDAK